MPNEAALRRLARLVLENGKLPRRDPNRTWGGPGVGAACAICDQPVTPEEIEYEVRAPGTDSRVPHHRDTLPRLRWQPRIKG
jgi:hypothetical protein